MTSAIRPSQTWGKKVIPFSKSPKPPGIAKSPQLFGIRISHPRAEDTREALESFWKR
jgi:hypothetical protein